MFETVSNPFVISGLALAVIVVGIIAIQVIVGIFRK